VALAAPDPDRAESLVRQMEKEITEIQIPEKRSAQKKSVSSETL
jgi:hypothetical protein